MSIRPYWFDSRWWSFQWRYWRGCTPWDTQVTPPEVLDFLRTAAPGRALDLGCGTGTNAIALARRGWRVTGLDFAPKAIRSARRKAAREHLPIDFRVADVSDLSGIQGLFDYALDIGCLHSLGQAHWHAYARGLQAHLKPDAVYMLYAWLPRIWRGKQRGMAVEKVHALFAPDFHQQKTIIGEESGGPSAWYWFVRR